MCYVPPFHLSRIVRKCKGGRWFRACITFLSKGRLSVHSVMIVESIDLVDLVFLVSFVSLVYFVRWERSAPVKYPNRFLLRRISRGKSVGSAGNHNRVDSFVSLFCTDVFS